MKKLMLLALPLTLNACSLAKMNATLAAGSIGCSPDKIKVTDMHYEMLSDFRSFKASCEGVTYICSGASDYVNATCTKQSNQEVKSLTKYEQPKLDKEECLKRKQFNSLLKCD